jgi:hypothetical protein
MRVRDKVVNGVPEEANLSICSELGFCAEDEQRIVSLGDPHEILFIADVIFPVEPLSL